jgi:hypothetical protein
VRKILIIGAAAGLAFILQPGVVLAAGAIAVDDDVATGAGDAGYGVGAGETREEAGAAALEACKKSGNDSCQIVVRYDKCGAYASSHKHAGIGWGNSADVARTKAMQDCGNDSCKVVVADCDE